MGLFDGVQRHISALLGITSAGQKTMSNSLPVVVASNQSALEVRTAMDPARISSRPVSVNTGAPTPIIPFEAGIKFVVLGLVLVAETKTTVTLAEGVGELPYDALTGEMTLEAGIPMVWPVSDPSVGWLSHKGAQSLMLVPGTATYISGVVVYRW